MTTRDLQTDNLDTNKPLGIIVFSCPNKKKIKEAKVGSLDCVHLDCCTIRFFGNKKIIGKGYIFVTYTNGMLNYPDRLRTILLAYGVSSFDSC